MPISARARRRRTSSPLQGPPGTRPVRGLRPLLTAKGRARAPSSRFESPELAFSRSAVRGVRRLMQRSCGSARHKRSAVRTSRPAHLLYRSSAVSPHGLGHTWPLFRPASAGKNPVRSEPGVQDAALRPAGTAYAGHPSHSAAVKTAGLACTLPTPPVIPCAGAPASTTLPLCSYS